MQQSYDTIAVPAQAEFVEKRSRFLSEIRPVTEEAQYAAMVAELRARHRDARHHCSACILREGGVLRYSDDGEPQGTAGMPILEVIRRENLFDVAVVVTRYFGGILLGAGGLTRAYAQGAKRAVDAARRVQMCLCTLFLLEAPYAMYDRLSLLLDEHGGLVLDTDFAADVTLSVRMRTEDLPAFTQALVEQSAGSLSPLIVGEEFAAV